MLCVQVGFTGSTGVGQTLRRLTAGTGKKLSLELGGKSPFIVFDSADLDAAVEGLVDAIWFNQGQVRAHACIYSCVYEHVFVCIPVILQVFLLTLTMLACTQVCSAGSRVLVQEHIHDRFVSKVKERMTHLRLGDSLDKCMDIGPIVDPSQVPSFLPSFLPSLLSLLLPPCSRNSRFI